MAEQITANDFRVQATNLGEAVSTCPASGCFYESEVDNGTTFQQLTELANAHIASKHQQS